MTDIIGPMNAANSVTVRPAETRTPGSVDTFFKPCSNTSTRDGTSIEVAWLNQVTAVLRALGRAPGLRLDGVTKVLAEDNSNDAILTQAMQHVIQRGQTIYVTDGGTANAVVFTPTPAPPEYINGMRFLILKSAAANTAAMTCNAAALTWADGSVLVAGDWPATTRAEVTKTAAGWALLSVMGPSVFARKASVGSITSVFSTQSITVPAYANHVLAKVWGATGAGGAGTVSGAAGSGAGAAGVGWGLYACTPGSTITATIGAAGTAVTNSSGNPGGTTSLVVGGSTVISITGSGGGAVSGGGGQLSVGAAGVPTGGNILSTSGSSGGQGVVIGSTGVGGYGGLCNFGAAGSPTSIGSGGGGIMPGGGGGGANTAQGGPGVAGYIELLFIPG